jgi:hypothetical protein
MKYLVLAFVLIFMVSGCAGFSIKSSDINFETLGVTLGGYMKIKHPDTVQETLPWVEGVVSMVGEDILEIDPISQAYIFLLKEFPEDAELLMLVKTVTDAFSLQFEIDGELNDNKYVEMVRDLLKGYLKGVS